MMQIRAALERAAIERALRPVGSACRAGPEGTAAISAARVRLGNPDQQGTAPTYSPPALTGHSAGKPTYPARQVEPSVYSHVSFAYHRG